MSQEKTVEKKLSKAAIETLAIIFTTNLLLDLKLRKLEVAFGTNTIEI